MEGTVVGGYTITTFLAEGGMGTVWLAEHGVMGRGAVVKLLHAELGRDPVVVGKARDIGDTPRAWMSGRVPGAGRRCLICRARAGRSARCTSPPHDAWPDRDDAPGRL